MDLLMKKVPIQARPSPHGKYLSQTRDVYKMSIKSKQKTKEFVVIRIDETLDTNYEIYKI